MRINTIHLQNFCCFEDRSFELAERFNLIVGDNGTGKTSLLNGIAVAVRPFLAQYGFIILLVFIFTIGQTIMPRIINVLFDFLVGR